MILILMGAAGAGKTTVGQALAGQLGWPFIDADDFHSPDNIARMRSGVPLTDADRSPWLARVRDAIVRLHAAGTNAVIACSALRQRYRDELAAGLDDVRWVYLAAPPALLEARLVSREGHFAGPSILAGQLADLEPPDDAIVVPASLPVDEVVTRIRAAIRS